MGVWSRYRKIRAERLKREASELKNYHNHSSERYLKLSQKSRGTAIILSLLFGPLGLLYVSPAAAVLLTIIAVIGSPTIIVPVAIWVLSIGLADHYAYKHNMRQAALVGILDPDHAAGKKENPRMLIWIIGMIVSLFVATASTDPNSASATVGSVMLLLFFVAMVVEIVVGLIRRSGPLNAHQKDIDYDNEIYLDVVGESFDNDDGTSRQEIIKKHVKVGTPVELRFYTFRGRSACAVLVDGKQIGNIAKEEVKSLRDILSSASTADARVDSVGVSRQSGLYGVSLVIRAAN